MENSIYLGLSRQMALRTNMDIIANNIANVNTPGYRGQNMLFQEFIDKPRGTLDPLSFVNDYGEYQITSPGSVSYTGNPLDIAVTGPGFIGVQGPDGVAYTRAGNFQMRADGTLITSAGFPVASAGGGNLTIPAGSTEVNIDDHGNISNQDGQLGQIMVHEFQNLRQLKPLGNNLYKADTPGTAATQSTVKQGQLEGSNVQPVIEMTRMIDTLRSFQSVQQVLQSENDRLRTAIQRLTRS